MKNFLLLITLSFLLITGCSKYNFTKTGKGLVLELPADPESGTIKKLNIEVLTSTVVKVSVSFNDSALNAPSLIAETTIDESVKFKIDRKKDAFTIKTDSLILSVKLPSGEISYFDTKGNMLLSENGNEFIPFNNHVVGKQNHILQRFNWTDQEAHYGLGQHRNGFLNLRGKRIELFQDNTEIAVPFLLSTNGYGILWDNYSRSVYSNIPDSNYLYADIGDKIQYYFIKGASFDKIIAGYRKLTGDAPMYPRWAFGYMQSRNRYRSENELIGVVEKQCSLNIPLDVIILDYYHWEDQGFGSFVFDNKNFPDPVRMIDKLHKQYNCKLLVSVWPSFTPGIKNWVLFDSRKYLLDVMAGFNTQVYDAFNPDAGKLYYDLIKSAYLNKGVDGWWFDATEPENMDAFYKSKSYFGITAKYLNLYSYYDMKNVYERQIKETDKRIYILTRSAFSGQQKFGTTVWSGDIEASFEELKLQIPAGLNLCMSGIPYWTTDIGGYKGGNPADPAYQEIFTRWFQYGTFCPVFRAHGRRFPGDRTGANEVWSYGKEKQEILTKFICLRYRLLPYIYSLSYKVTNEGYTIMRGLPFDFMSDSCVYGIRDQFMFGSEFMVCPVTEAKANHRSVYLPSGSQWYDFWTGKKYEGGQEIAVDAPIETMPLFVRSGSIVPMGPVMQYSTEKRADPIELRIFPGRDASFELYEDENDNLNYLDGNHQQIHFSYNDAAGTLTIGSAKGDFPGCIKERKFNIILVDQNHGVGVEEQIPADHIIHYRGDDIVINF